MCASRLVCRRPHAGPRFGNDFDILAKQKRLLRICRAHDLRIPEGYLDRLSTIDSIGRALNASPPPSVPCHNDPLPENFIDSGGVIRIIDYQLAGNNDQCFELGDIAAEADLDPDRTEALAGAYFGDELTPALSAWVRLSMLLSNVVWTLWFSLHHGLLHHHAATFDYWSDAADKWNRAVRDLDSSEFGRLLATAGRQTAPTRQRG